MSIAINGLGWFGFWVFLCVLAYVDHKAYLAGHDGWFFTHATPEEKELQRAQIDAIKRSHIGLEVKP